MYLSEFEELPKEFIISRILIYYLLFFYEDLLDVHFVSNIIRDYFQIN